jgi:adhesin transport system membrane fusion protein
MAEGGMVEAPGGRLREVSAGLPAVRLIPPPLRARRVAATLVVVFALIVALLALAPWQQSVTGKGRVIAYAPMERQQVLEAPVKGVVVQWWVQEGSRVAAGDPLLELRDNDPLLMERLEIELELTEGQVATYGRQAEALRERVEAERRARQFKVASAEAKVRTSERELGESRQKVLSTEAKLETNLLQLARERTLYEQGLTSQRSLELAQLYEVQARNEREGARQAYEAKREGVTGKREELSMALADGDAKVEKSVSELEKAEAELVEGRRKLLMLQSKIAKQSNQVVRAPRAGTVLRLLVPPGSGQVKEADPLLVLVPEGIDQAVELWVDGNDAALISPGRHVRLQFEGWPAVQFTGWPSVAVGTFGGEVALVDAADDGQGNFRVVVRPEEGDEPWPESALLRQGVRANGWVMLDVVSLGYEVWRQFNGFPPAVDPESVKGAGKGAADKGKDK